MMRDMKRWIAVLLLLLAGGCSNFKMSPELSSLGFLHGYEAVLHDFNNGRVMEARSRVLAMDRKDPDYARAQVLLRKRIEPARKRLLEAYSKRAAQAEKDRRWVEAMRNYEQAATFSARPEMLRRKSRQMAMKMRQSRFELLLRQRRNEDQALLAALEALENPRGLDAQDPVMAKERERRLDVLEDRARQAYRDADRYLGSELPEMAYVAIESYLRLVPDSERGQKLKARILKAMPAGIRIPSNTHAVQTRKRLAVHKHVTRKEIDALVRQKRYVDARMAALVYRRNGGKDGDKLLKSIEQLMDREAASYYAMGKKMFQQEKLDQAIRYWRKAVSLRPDQTEYVDALRRAELLKERLGMLR